MAVSPPVVVLEIAPWSRQLGAAAIDAVGAFVLAALGARLTLAALDIRPAAQAVVDVVHTEPARLLPLPLVVIAALVLWQASALALQATPGQRMCGLRLVHREGTRPGAARLALRAVVNGAGAALLLAGPAFALFLDGLRRGPGDVVAGTVAVRRDRA